MKVTTGKSFGRGAGYRPLLIVLAGIASFIASAQASEAQKSVPRLRVVQSVPETPCDAPAGTWTLVVLPDTQYYTRSYPSVYQRQTEWIAKNREAHDIRFVVHEGDITNNNTPDQWKVAQKAHAVLKQSRIPYTLLPGNHDLGPNGDCSDRSTLLNKYFSPADYANSASFGLFEENKLENSWHTLDTPSGKFLILALEFMPRDEVLAWANEAVARHQDRKVIVVTHAYLMGDSTLSDVRPKPHGNARTYGIAPNANDGRGIWDKLISRHTNMRIVLNGHIATNTTGTARLVSTGAGGVNVNQILANYQDNSGKNGGTVRPGYGYGGGGYLRLMQFLPDGVTVRVRTYSPFYDEWLGTPDQQFEFKL